MINYSYVLDVKLKTCRVTGKINQRLARLARLAKALRLGILIPFRLKIDIKN
jgi:hypothetical protein